MNFYIWQRAHWQNFLAHYDKPRLLEPLTQAHFMLGRLSGRINMLSAEWRAEILHIVRHTEAIASAKIDDPQNKPHQAHALAEIWSEATALQAKNLSLTRLNAWHKKISPKGGSPRTGEASIGKDENEIFAAPPLPQAGKELDSFLERLNEGADKGSPLLRASAAHINFLTIRPYNNGNGRLARAVTALALYPSASNDAQEYTPVVSISAQLLKNRAEYFELLSEVQTARRNLGVWHEWFITQYTAALQDSHDLLNIVFRRAEFWQKTLLLNFNSRQTSLIHSMLLGRGAVSTKIYAAENSLGTASAFRELNELKNAGLLCPEGKGCTVQYRLPKDS
ncbi:cell filamentation protein Fic [Candidatus Termititenax spirochaetophilus]|uniref:Cell filamentation protein Fic n=1 Tax=Candidatus Termititenax spirochaetophilus TaxID=2218522 RepID=A0A388T878_9BACT|nr:cell filamentation protein Fic [Candidatus Termititenax spirochaetophilus]